MRLKANLSSGYPIPLRPVNEGNPLHEFSIVICTYGGDRLHLLEKALKALEVQSFPRHRYHVRVIANGPSTEGLKAFLVKWAAKSPGYREWRSCPQVGAGASRNHGAAVASGKYVFFLDDDALPGPDWLSRYATFIAAHPDAVCFGGPVRLTWEDSRPSWVVDSILPLLSELKVPERTARLKEDQYLLSANLVCRRAEFLRMGGFDSRLGRRERLLLSNEDILLVRRFQAAGHPCYSVPEAVVSHPVHAERLSRAWLYRRLYWQGFSDAWTERLLHPHDRKQRLREAFRHSLGLPRLLLSFISGGWIPSGVETGMHPELVVLRWIGFAWGQFRTIPFEENLVPHLNLGEADEA